MGHGPAACGWPAALAHNWHQRLRKLTEQLSAEVPKYKADLRAADEKLKKAGQKAHEHLVKEANIAKSRLEKNEVLTSLQQDAHEFINESRCIKISELPADYEKDRQRILLYEVGVCSKCRNQSGCLNCDEFKCTRAWMRREHKRTGRPIEAQYQ